MKISEKPSGSTPRGAMGIAFLTILLDLVGFGIMIPIQPFFAETLGASPSTVTMLGASYSVMQFLFVPFWGRLSDRVGRKPVILISIAIGTMGYVIFANAQELWLLFAARMLAGFGNANIATAQAIVADTTTAENRAKGMGILGAAFGIGFILGPVIGGVLGQISPQAPAVGAAVLGGLNLISAALFLRETFDASKRHGAERSRRFFSPGAVLDACRRYGVGVLFWLIFVSTVSFSIMEHVLSLFIERTWAPGGVSEAHAHFAGAAMLTAYVMVTVGVTGAIVQGGLIGRLSKRFSEPRLIRIGSAILAVALVLIPVVGMYGPFAGMIAVAVLLAFGSGIAHPTTNALLSGAVGDREQGTVLGIGQSLSALGRIVGPASAGFLFETSKNTPFFVAAAIMVLAFFSALRVRKKGLA